VQEGTQASGGLGMDEDVERALALALPAVPQLVLIRLAQMASVSAIEQFDSLKFGREVSLESWALEVALDDLERRGLVVRGPSDIFLVWAEEIAPELRERMKVDPAMLAEGIVEHREVEASLSERRPVGDGKLSLRIRAIVAYGQTCAYCSRQGVALLGPDGKAWHLDRINPGALGGEYVAENVCLSCQTCNLRKSDAPSQVLVRNLLAVETGVEASRTTGAIETRPVELTAEARDWLLAVTLEGARWGVTPSDVVTVGVDVWESSDIHEYPLPGPRHRTLLRLSSKDWEQIQTWSLVPGGSLSESRIVGSVILNLMRMDAYTVARGMPAAVAADSNLEAA